MTTDSPIPVWVHRSGWLLVALLACWLWSDPPQWLFTRCGAGWFKYHIAAIGYGLIAGRAALALAVRDRSIGWVAQLLLLVLLAPLVEAIVVAAGSS